MHVYTTVSADINRFVMTDYFFMLSFTICRLYFQGCLSVRACDSAELHRIGATLCGWEMCLYIRHSQYY